MRSKDRTRLKGIWNDSVLDKVFRKAKYVSGAGDTEIREDKYGGRIRRWSYGAEAGFGWKLSRIKSDANDEADDFSNFEPVHWKSGRADDDTSDSELSCLITERA